MVKIAKVDRRITRTKKSIVNSFLQLLSQRKFNDITVIDIVDAADISKATFYLHYKNKDQILDQTILDLFNQIHDWINVNKPISLYTLYLNIFRIFYSQKELLKILVHAGVDLKIMEISRNFSYNLLRDSIITDFSLKPLPYLNDFLAGGFYLVIYEWLKNGFQETPEEMARTCENFYNIVNL